MKAARGVTLLELLLASSLGLVVLLAMAQVDVARILIGQQAQDIAEIQAEPAFAVTHLACSLTQADRVELLSATCASAANPGSCVKLRLPPENGTGLDVAANYTWVQYRLSGTTLKYFKPTSPCTVATQFANIASLSLTRSDNNLVEILITSTAADPQSSAPVTFRGQATLRAGTTDLTTGLLPAGTGEPPSSCS